MNSRERWTVYPLLFLALGLAVRSAAIPPDTFVTARIEGLDATRLVCREIVVQADDGTILVHFGWVGGGGAEGSRSATAMEWRLWLSGPVLAAGMAPLSFLTSKAAMPAGSPPSAGSWPRTGRPRRPAHQKGTACLQRRRHTSS